MMPDPRCRSLKLDELMPEWDIRSSHSIEIAAPAETVAQVMQSSDFSNSRTIRFLMSLRRFGRLSESPKTLEERKAALRRAGFYELAHVPNSEILIGVAGRFWRPSSGIEHLAFNAETFQQYNRIGYTKAAWNFSVTPLGADRCLLCTQTRILCFGNSARWKFRLYWSVVGPFSGLIRHEMLRLIKSEAEALVNAQKTA